MNSLFDRALWRGVIPVSPQGHRGSTDTHATWPACADLGSWYIGQAVMSCQDATLARSLVRPWTTSLAAGMPRSRERQRGARRTYTQLQTSLMHHVAKPEYHSATYCWELRGFQDISAGGDLVRIDCGAGHEGTPYVAHVNMKGCRTVSIIEEKSIRGLWISSLMSASCRPS